MRISKDNLFASQGGWFYSRKSVHFPHFCCLSTCSHFLPSYLLRFCSKCSHIPHTFHHDSSVIPFLCGWCKTLLKRQFCLSPPPQFIFQFKSTWQFAHQYAHMHMDSFPSLSPQLQLAILAFPSSTPVGPPSFWALEGFSLDAPLNPMQSWRITHQNRPKVSNVPSKNPRATSEAFFSLPGRPPSAHSPFPLISRQRRGVGACNRRRHWLVAAHREINVWPSVKSFRGLF